MSEYKFPFKFANDYEKNKDEDEVTFINYVSKKIAKRIVIIQNFNDGSLDKDDLTNILQEYLPKYLNKSKHIMDKLNNK